MIGRRHAATAAALVAVSGLALVAAGCGGSAANHVAQLGTVTQATPSPAPLNSSGSGKSAALAFSRCMRSHHVSKFPDLTNATGLSSRLPKVSVSLQQLGVSSSVFDAAERACRHLLPNGGQTTPSQSQQDLNAMRAFARCMRSHGVPTWPDPTNGPAGWGFDLLHVSGFDPNSPQIDNKMTICQRRLPTGIPGIPLSRPGRPG